MKLCRQATCGIDHHHIATPCFASGHSIERHGGRVGAFLADDFNRVSAFVAVCPNSELLLGRRPEGVGSRQQDAGTLPAQMPSQLANRGGLASAIDASDHHHRGLMLAHGERFLQRAEQISQALREQGFDGARLRGFGFFHAALQISQ